MLTKIEKETLNFCKEKNATSYQELEPLYEKYGHEHVFLTFKELNSKGMFKHCTFALGGFPYNFELSFKALHYSEITRNEIKSFVFTSIFTPILVSCATTLLIWTVQSMLK